MNTNKLTEDSLSSTHTVMADQIGEMEGRKHINGPMICTFWDRLCQLYFPGATLGVQGWQDLLRALHEAGVTMEERVLGGVWIPDTHVTREEERQLNAARQIRQQYP